MERKHCPAEFKVAAVAFHRPRPGTTIRSVAGDLGVNTETLRNGSGPPMGCVPAPTPCRRPLPGPASTTSRRSCLWHAGGPVSWRKSATFSAGRPRGCASLYGCRPATEAGVIYVPPPRSMSLRAGVTAVAFPLAASPLAVTSALIAPRPQERPGRLPRSGSRPGHARSTRTPTAPTESPSPGSPPNSVTRAASWSATSGSRGSCGPPLPGLRPR